MTNHRDLLLPDSRSTDLRNEAIILVSTISHRILETNSSFRVTAERV